MASSRGTRSLFATAVGCVIVAVIAYFVLRFVVGTIFGLIRTIVVIAVLGGLLVLYLKLKLPDGAGK
jgi:tetrahydromethanopterin S-methyltransferase subunit C